MKLLQINEDISRKDFFDFYALMHASTDGSHPRQKEILQRLTHIVDTILQDHLGQLGKIVLYRISNTDDERTVRLLGKYNITSDEDYVIHGIDELSIDEMASLISDIIKEQEHFGFTGETWYGLAAKFIKLSQHPSGLKNKILVIDQIYNLLHHGGMITDYMDESKWIEDALNVRDNANPNQILGLASRDIVDLIGPSSYHGQPRGKVEDIDKLYTAFRRVIKNKPGIDIIKDGKGTLKITGRYTRGRYNDFNIPSMLWGGKLPAFWADRIGPDDKLEQSPMYEGSVYVKDNGNEFVIGNYVNELFVSKPVRSFYKLADDIVLQIPKNVDGKEMITGFGISSIKQSY